MSLSAYSAFEEPVVMVEDGSGNTWQLSAADARDLAADLTDAADAADNNED